jgi:hypothetical protein
MTFLVWYVDTLPGRIMDDDLQRRAFPPTAGARIAFSGPSLVNTARLNKSLRVTARHHVGSHRIRAPLRQLLVARGGTPCVCITLDSKFLAIDLQERRGNSVHPLSPGRQEIGCAGSEQSAVGERNDETVNPLFDNRKFCKECVRQSLPTLQFCLSCHFGLRLLKILVRFVGCSIVGKGGSKSFRDLGSTVSNIGQVSRAD